MENNKNKYFILKPKFGNLLRSRLETNNILPLIGIYDVFSAALVAKKFEAIFCSGYGFAASYYGLPDEGYITWTDMVAYVERIRAVLPSTHIVVDIDDGYGDPNIAANIACRLERVGASAVILEDQRRPKKCGHLPGKEILAMEEYMPRLKAVLDIRENLFVVARTDTVKMSDGIERAQEFARAGADAILIEGIKDINQLKIIREAIGVDTLLMINLIAGGKTDPVTLGELSELGVNMVNYSTPCLFAAHKAIDDTLDRLIKEDGKLIVKKDDINLEKNNKVLKSMLKSALFR
jgi:2-methylisocitrate lyase-like PEP mutase family enzyme